MHAAVQRDYSGIGSVSVEYLDDPDPGLAGTLIEGSYAPVMPWDIKSEEGAIRGKRLPSVVGYAIGGTVVGAGPLGARDLLGRRVVTAAPRGSNAQKAVAPLAPLVFPIPDPVGTAEAATVIGGGDAALMLSKAANLRHGDRALVAGANGGVGTWLVQLLNLRGIETHVLSSPRSLAINQELFPNNRVTDESADLGVEYAAAIDLTGSGSVLRTLERAVLSGGLLVMSATPDYRPARNDVKATFRNGPISPGEYRRLLALLADRSVDAVIDAVYPLDRVRDAQLHVSNEAHRGRTLLRLNEDADDR